MFKKSKLMVLCVSIILSLSSCLVNNDHQIRIKNSTGGPLTGMYIDDVSYGDISNGTTSEYKSVADGSGTHNVTGRFNNGKYTWLLDGHFATMENRSTNYTVTIDENGYTSCSED